MEIEWKNGDDVDAYGKLYKYVGLDPFNENLCICLANQDGDPQCFSIGILKKPETPQQREERERLENGKSLHTAASKTEEAIAHGIFRLWEMEEKETRNHYCQLAEIIGHKTNYRK